MVLNYPMLRLVTVTSKLDWHSLQLLCNELVKLIFRKTHFEQGEIHKNSNGLAPMASLPSLCICYTRCINQGSRSVSSEFNGCRSRTRVSTVKASKFNQDPEPELLSKHPCSRLDPARKIEFQANNYQKKFALRAING